MAFEAHCPLLNEECTTMLYIVYWVLCTAAGGLMAWPLPIAHLRLTNDGL